MSNQLAPKLVAEFIGTFALIFIGAGAAAVVGDGAGLGGIAAIAFAHGLTVMAFAFAYGNVSGGHFNPAVTIGLWSAGRCAAADVIPYIVAQVIAAIAAAGVLWLIASSQPGWVPGGFAANGYGDLSPGKYGLAGCFVTEGTMERSAKIRVSPEVLPRLPGVTVVPGLAGGA